MAKKPKLKARKLSPCGPVDVPAVWSRIEACVGTLAPNLVGNLAPGATGEEIDAFEKVIGRRLPEEVRASFRAHNGQLYWAPDHKIIRGFDFGSVAWSTDQWNNWSDFEDDSDMNEHARDWGSSTPKAAIRLGYANRNWISLADVGYQGCFGADFAPGAKGVSGQVINFGRNEEHKIVMAWSWGWFLNDLADELEAGNFRFDSGDKDRGLVLISPEQPNSHFYNVREEWSKAKTSGRRPFDPLTAETLAPLRADTNVMRLARVIAENRDFNSLPILGDALEEAGCTDKPFLLHCRQPGDHGCGCWAVNLLLGTAPEFVAPE